MNRLFCMLLAASTAALVGAAPAWAGSVVTVPGTADPYLAGMPNGSTASFGDVAPNQSPVLVPGVLPAAGNVLTFTNVSGSVSYAGGAPVDPPDGDNTFFLQHFDQLPGSTQNPENGISDMIGPVDALVGVFLGAGQPDLNTAPNGLDFTGNANGDFTNVPGGTDFTSISPVAATGGAFAGTPTVGCIGTAPPSIGGSSY